MAERQQLFSLLSLRHSLTAQRCCRSEVSAHLAGWRLEGQHVIYHEYWGSENTIQCTLSAITNTANRIGISQVAGFRISQTFQSSSGFFGRGIGCSAMEKPYRVRLSVMSGLEEDGYPGLLRTRASRR
jgi:hypothetical protein